MAEKSVDFEVGDEVALLDACKRYLQNKKHGVTKSLARQTWILQKQKQSLAAEAVAPTNIKLTLEMSIERIEKEVEVLRRSLSALNSIQEAFAQGKYEPLILMLEQFSGTSQMATVDFVSGVEYPVKKMHEELLVVWFTQQEQQQ